MQLGYFVDPIHPAGSDFTRTIHDDLDQLVVLDRLGYAEAWIAEHFTTVWENIPSPELFIAQAIGMTRSIRLGTGVTCLPNHNPFHLAHRIAQLDHQARGRFMWGIGSGATPLDFKAFGIDAASGEQRALAWETLDMVLRIWEGLAPGTYGNRFWKFTMPEPMEDLGFYVHIRPYQMPHPPIAAASISPRSDTLEAAGRNDWIPISANNIPARVLRSQWETYAAASRDAGHSPDRSRWRVCRDVFVADTAEEAREVAMRGVMARDFVVYFRNVLQRLGFLRLVKVHPDTRDEDIDLEYMVDNVWIVGSPDEVADRLAGLYDDVGGFGTLVVWSHEWEPRDRWVRSMSLLAEKVVPALSGLTPAAP